MATESAVRDVHHCECPLCREHPRGGPAAEHRAINRLLAFSNERVRPWRKPKAGLHDAHRDRRLRYLIRLRKLFLAKKWPVISVDTKKKELIGEFKNPGRCWRQRDREVLDHDYPTWASGQAIPTGIYDLAGNDVLVVIGTTRESLPVAA